MTVRPLEPTGSKAVTPESRIPRLQSWEYVKETNALIMKAIGDTMRVVAFSQTDEYWEEVVKKYEILKSNKTN